MSDADEPEGTYAIYFAEGESLAKQGQFNKAIDSYSKALDLLPEDKLCLVARSRCYLRLGDTALALLDAEDSLKENKLNHRGLYQKAEVLYAMGDFEHALVFYHRGNKVRPELTEFKLGIQKAQEAVNNSIGNPDSCKLEKIGDLTFFQQQENIGKKAKKKLIKPGQVVQQKKERKPIASERTTKELLGEMYADREYLDKLMGDPSLVIGRKDRSIYKTAENALIYLDARTEFWRQQKPMYARKREKELKRYKPSPTIPIPMGRLTATTTVGSHTKLILRSLEEIDTALANGDAESSLIKAQRIMKTVEALTDKDLPNKNEFVASLYSCIGNAQLELGEADLALEHHLKDLELAKKLNQKEMLSRALDNVGRVYAVMGKFRRASEFWTEKLPLITSAEESAWLHHELGRCQLELGNFVEAVDIGRKSLSSAEEASDQMWQLNASMLIAQAKSRMNEFDSAVEMFERALRLAKMLEDEVTEASIVKAMEEVREKLEADVKGEDSKKEGPGRTDGGAEKGEGSGGTEDGAKKGEEPDFGGDTTENEGSKAGDSQDGEESQEGEAGETSQEEGSGESQEGSGSKESQEESGKESQEESGGKESQGEESQEESGKEGDKESQEGSGGKESQEESGGKASQEEGSQERNSQEGGVENTD